MIANPTLLVMTLPLAITKKPRSFFSGFTPTFSNIRAGIQVYSLPVSTSIFGITADLSVYDVLDFAFDEE
jgi:hypothetical protein